MNTLENIKEKIDSSTQDELKMYFIVRKEKSGVSQKTKKKLLEKYDFQVLKVDINDEIRNFMYGVVKEQVNNSVRQNLEINEYDIIADDQNQIFTYSQKNKIGSFINVIDSLQNKQSEIVSMQNFSELFEQGSLWAYSVELAYKEDDISRSLLTFRKISSGQLVVNEKENGNKVSKSFMALFSTQSNKLEMLNGSAVKLDKQVDCIYIDDVFYVLHKSQFEAITGLSEEYKEAAKKIVSELNNTNSFQGLDHMSTIVENNTAIHKKLLKIKNLSNYNNITKTILSKMKKAAKKEKYELKTNDSGQIIMENEKDVNMIVKLLCDYYKEGVVSGKQYGTYSGREIKE
ncbi:MAG: DUF4868 domain-containing protein [Bacteroidales bacterium]|nr:DUF4868 domain-containing protein [Bacteroidales bacterium]